VKFIIVGGGNTAQILIENLMDEYPNAKITVIEKDKKTCELLVEKFPVIDVIHGDAADPYILEKAEVANADVFIALTGDDSQNVISSLMARNMGVEKVIVRVGNPKYKELAKELGIKYVVTPSESTALQINFLLRGPGYADLAKLLSRDVDVLEVVVKEETELKEYWGKLLMDDAYPMFIVRGDKVYAPESNMELKPGDKLIILRCKRKKWLRIFKKQM